MSDREAMKLAMLDIERNAHLLGVTQAEQQILGNTPLRTTTAADCYYRLRVRKDELRAHLAAPRPEPVAWGVRWKNTNEVVNATINPQLAHEWRQQQVMEVLPLYTAPPAAAPEPTHPGYILGSHWLETAYSRICAGEAEAEVLRDCGWERVADIDALRRDAELGRWIREETPPIEEIAARVDAMEDET